MLAEKEKSSSAVEVYSGPTTKKRAAHAQNPIIKECLTSVLYIEGSWVKKVTALMH